MRWRVADNTTWFGATVGGRSLEGTRRTRLNVADNFTATIGAADFQIGHCSRRGTPGRALVDNGPDALVVNFEAEWA